MRRRFLLATSALLLFTGWTLLVTAQQPAGKDQPRPKAEQPARGAFEVRRDVEYGRAGDKPLTLDVYGPKDRKAEKLPVIVWIHGGGWRAGNKSSGGRLTPFVASGNYVGVAVGYRLSGEAIWPAQIHDCKAAIRWVRANAEQLGIDPDKIGVWGNSAGGHLVSLLGTSGGVAELEGENGSADASSRVTCVVDFCGPTDMARMRHSAVDELFGKPLEEREAEAKAASPVTHVTKDDPPTLIVHGTKDGTVPIEQADLFYEKLKQTGVDVHRVTIEGGGHGIGGAEVMRRVAEFFEKHLRGQDVAVEDAVIKAENR